MTALSRDMVDVSQALHRGLRMLGLIAFEAKVTFGFKVY